MTVTDESLQTDVWNLYGDITDTWPSGTSGFKTYTVQSSGILKCNMLIESTVWFFNILLF
jgi:hypothetical protein